MKQANLAVKDSMLLFSWEVVAGRNMAFFIKIYLKCYGLTVIKKEKEFIVMNFKISSLLNQFKLGSFCKWAFNSIGNLKKNDIHIYFPLLAFMRGSSGICRGIGEIKEATLITLIQNILVLFKCFTSLFFLCMSYLTESLSKLYRKMARGMS